MSTMTVVLPAEMIAERQRLGLDIRDEVWDGVYHVVPPASGAHQRFGVKLISVLFSLTERDGLHLGYETGVFDPNGPPQRDYCVSDLVVYRPEHTIPAGVNGRAELVIEIRSPGDDSLAKVPYYSRVGVQELLVIEPDTKDVRQWVTGASGLAEVPALVDGWHTLTAVAMRVRGVDGRLEIEADGQITTI